MLKEMTLKVTPLPTHVYPFDATHYNLLFSVEVEGKRVVNVSEHIDVDEFKSQVEVIASFMIQRLKEFQKRKQLTVAKR